MAILLLTMICGNTDNTSFIKKFETFYNSKKIERIKKIGENQNNELEKRIFLQIIDFNWRSHLQYLEQLRQVIGLRSYGQKDPLSEFKKEAFGLFESLLKRIKNDLNKFIIFRLFLFRFSQFRTIKKNYFKAEE